MQMSSHFVALAWKYQNIEHQLYFPQFFKSFFKLYAWDEKQCSLPSARVGLSFDLALERWNPHSAARAGGGAVTPSGHFH